jgi:hemoglobin-like flavoprotein
MSPEQKTLVQETWQQLAPKADQAALLFYERLFAIDTTARPLFRSTDLAEQGRKLIQALTLVVRGLNRPEALVPSFAELGRQHARLGVSDRHYDSVGAALLWTLERKLGSGWTPQVEAAWTSAYLLLANVMRKAGQELGAATSEASVDEPGALDAGQPQLDPDWWIPGTRRT